MSTHRYRIAQQVGFFAPLVPASAGDYHVVALVPATENGEPQYRIKSSTESYERLALERHLTGR